MLSWCMLTKYLILKLNLSHHWKNPDQFKIKAKLKGVKDINESEKLGFIARNSKIEIRCSLNFHL